MARDKASSAKVRGDSIEVIRLSQAGRNREVRRTRRRSPDLKSQMSNLKFPERDREKLTLVD
jgi:hypothetical protein